MSGESPLLNPAYRNGRRVLIKHGWHIIGADAVLGTIWELRKNPSQAKKIRLTWWGTRRLVSSQGV